MYAAVKKTTKFFGLFIIEIFAEVFLFFILFIAGVVMYQLVIWTLIAATNLAGEVPEALYRLDSDFSDFNGLIRYRRQRADLGFKP